MVNDSQPQMKRINKEKHLELNDDQTYHDVSGQKKPGQLYRIQNKNGKMIEAMYTNTTVDHMAGKRCWIMERMLQL